MMPQTKSTPPARQLAATLFMSLDGVVEEPQKWSFAYWNAVAAWTAMSLTMALAWSAHARSAWVRWLPW